MARVDLTFAGSSRGAVQAAHETTTAIKKTAAETVQAKIKEREALKQEVAGYKQVAAEAKRGSRERIVANDLAAKSERKLAQSIGATRHEAILLGRAHAGSNRDLERGARGAIAGSGAFKGLGRSIAFASSSFLGAAGFTAVVRKSVSAASDLHEQLNKTDVVFRSSARVVKDWSKDTATSLGIARSEALAYAGTFGNMLVPMGFARHEAANMSVEMVKLAADMASFNNASPEDTLAALQSGLAGQVRPLREFGVFLSQDRIKAEALASGVVKANVSMQGVADAQTKIAIAQAKLAEARRKYGEGTTQVAAAEVTLHAAEAKLHKELSGHVVTLTAAQKALASYKIIMKDTADAQGDFARTSGGLANQQRILRAQVTNLEEEAGKALLPTVLKIVKATTQWLEKSEKNGDIQRDLKSAVKGVKDVVDTTWPIVKTLAHWLKEASDIAGGWKDSFKLILGGYLAVKLLGVRTAVMGIGTQAAVSTGEVGALRGALMSLGGPGVLGALKGTALGLAAIAAAYSQKDERIGGSRGEQIALSQADEVVGNKFRYGSKWYTWNGKKAVPTSPPAKGYQSSGGSTGRDAQGGYGSGVRGGTARGRAVAQAALNEQGVPYSWGGGGAHGPSKGTGRGANTVGLDCSGLAQYAMAQIGISIPRTSQEQFARAPYHPPVSELEPGDLVFYEGSHPGHVAVYIGGGQVVHAPHTGTTVQTTTVHMMPITGTARWWGAKSETTKGGGGKGGANTNVDLGAGGDLVVGKASHTKKPRTVSSGAIAAVKASVDADLKDISSLTKGGMGDLVKGLDEQLKKLEGRLRKGMSPDAFAALKRQIAKIHKEIAEALGIQDLRGQITNEIKSLAPLYSVGMGEVADSLKAKLLDLRKQLRMGLSAADVAILKRNLAKLKTEVKAAIEAAKKEAELRMSAFERAFGRVRDAILQAFDRVTEANIQKMQRAFALKLRDAQRQFDRTMRDFNRATEKHLQELADAAAAPTPAEQALQDLEAAHAAAENARHTAELEQQLSTDTAAGADPAQIAADQQAIADDAAQRAYDSQVAALQKQAEAERKARDAQLADDQQHYQDERDELAQHMQDEFDILVQAWQDQEDAAERAYSDQRDKQRAALEDQLADIEEHLKNRQDAWAAADAILAGLIASDAGTMGKAFSDAMIEAAQIAHAAWEWATTGVITTFPKPPGGGAWNLGDPGKVDWSGVPGADPNWTPTAPATTPTAPAATVGSGSLITRKGLDGYAAGGKIPGDYIGRDDAVFARVTPGEHVTDRRLTRALEDAFLTGGGAGARGPILVQLHVDGRRFAEVLVDPLTSAQNRRISYRSDRG